MTFSGFAKQALIATIAAVVTFAAVAPASARHYRHRHHYKHHHYTHHHRHHHAYYQHRHRAYVGNIEPFGPGSGVVVVHRGGARFYDPRYGDPAPFGTYHRYAYRTDYYR